jgi:hypothetical protein
VEFESERFGPYHPVSGPIPLHRYRAFKRGKNEEQGDRIRQLADVIALPLTALTSEDVQLRTTTLPMLPKQPFDSQALEYHFPNHIAAKLAIADELGRPLAQLSPEEKAFIHQVLEETMIRRIVLERVREHFLRKPQGGEYAR